MKEGIGKELNLNLLLEGLFGLNHIEIEEFGRKTYATLFLSSKVSGIQLTHDGQKVTFSVDRFDHAFYESPAKNLIDKSRVARIRWILPLIQGVVINSQCWLVNENGIEKRLYVCYGLNYVVWLEPQDNKESWVFSSAYVAERKEIQEYTSRGVLLQKFNNKEKKKKKKGS